MPEITYPDVRVTLTGTDGNAFMVIGRITGALRRQVSPDAATRFAEQALACHTYNEVLVLAQSTVDVD